MPEKDVCVNRPMRVRYRHMTLPHQSFLDQFGMAIKMFAPAIPQKIQDQAIALRATLEANPEATEEQIHDALVTIGRAEFPYRHAYQELVGSVGAAELQEMVLDHVEPNVKAKLEQYLANGVSLEEFVKSDVFEHELSAEERYQVQDGVLDAQEHVQEHGPKMLEEKKAEFEALVQKWTEHEQMMQQKIDELKALAGKDAKWKEEILDKVKMFEEGWSVVERDPQLQEIEKEIEYWKGTLEPEA